MEIVAAVGGLIVLVMLMAVAIRLFRQPRHRYLGELEPRGRRAFLETMFVWLMGPRK